MKQLTVTEALRELSLYSEKINKAMANKKFVAVVKQNSDKAKKEEFIKTAKANYESINAIIENRNKIKSAVIQSNAVTKVTINEETMTVAEAIDKKHSLNEKQSLLNRLVIQSQESKDTLKVQDERIDDAIDDLIKRIAASEANDVGEKRKVLEEAYRKSHAYEIVDPIGIDKEIERIRDEIDGFLKEVDVALSVSNAVTIIEVDI